jgi:hypothetical protein
MSATYKGIYAVEEAMPCSPRDIRVRHYMLPQTLERAESEEAAARILSFSQQLNQWAGVSWPRLMERLQWEYEAQQLRTAVQTRNRDERWRVQSAMQKYFWLCVLTLGFYAFFAKKPQADLRPEPACDVPFSGALLVGPEPLIGGLHELVESGMLRREDEGEGQSATTIFFPTSKLVSRIMEVQGVAA